LTETPASASGRGIDGRLVAWCAFVGSLTALSYGANLSDPGDPANDMLYKWSTAIGGAIQFALMTGIAWAIARHLGRDTLGLRRPGSWRRAVGLMLAALVAIWVLGAILGQFLDAGGEQGLVPDSWDSSRAAPFAANFFVVAIIAPFVEELVYRGIGFGLISTFTGPVVAIVVTSLAFGLGHGLVVALPVLSLFGAILGWLRWKTASLYPPMILHGIFNAVALIAAVTVEAS
jgi:membrane protease YdiL (CAAX protease family)